MSSSTVIHDSSDPLGQQKGLQQFKHVERVEKPSNEDLTYENDEEPELHAQTYIALAAMFLLNLVQVFALLGPPSGLSYIEKDLNDTLNGTWVPNSLSLVQAVLAPLISSASDTFQARKVLLVVPAIISFIGCAIAPGSGSIYRLIAAQVLIGFGFATVPLAYCIPSEIIPRKWRPMAQAFMNIAAALGACAGPLIIGSLTKKNPHTGWRYFYWIQMALWGMTAVCLFVGYRPPKRHTRLDHLSFYEKLGRLDIPGMFLLTAGLTLLLTGLNLGGGLYPWASATVLATLIIGILALIAFGIYEWRFTTTGILHHDLFKGPNHGGRTFGICIGLIFIEGVLLFAFVIFYPVLTKTLFETDPFLNAARQQPYWIASALSTLVYGYASVKFRTIRFPMIAGFVILTGGIVGLTTIQPGNDFNALAFAALTGLGFGAPLILIIAGVQLSVPHHLIATATAATTCSRAVAAAVFTAIASAAMNSRLEKYIPTYTAKAALEAGLPKSSLVGFIKALTSEDTAALQKVAGVSSHIIEAGVMALKQAYADGVRIVFIIAAPFGVVAILACIFLGDLKSVMNYGVDAPVENLQAKHSRQDNV
ncbi:hypothetical protein PENANT_c005G09775 [Penicillium antarcticum]|uniref:Major facilitator superfamily (MFS) profile domain-containing protein n=1 Tax=Penicillium antarcticum TaxID=416450 RepID=A0A1V6QF72_9EURO|nr:uncharacterized protein N7508_007830 [Penicillium antarcticum]KAJ5297581.1 hypothetical protein N7508_007830 [Penicillium antarcticum]OQD87854.1 hypothetical protein PENANT_c005G09775 [Penicillium antarcticum]